MKDFAQMKVTLQALSDLQADLLNKKETAENWYQNYNTEFKQYSRRVDHETGDVAYFKLDNEGGEIDCSEWDYEYALERVNQEKRAVKAYTDILSYLDNFKL